ncbi:MAG: thiamine phosphate synthase [Candidatus Omnitrophica bacterium]|nr:thiamine phosphate synthase [Candidatus Omnitrophota bacterium]
MIKDYSLYLVATEEYGRPRPALEIAESAIKGGVDIIQMREKDKPGDELVYIGKELSRLCRDNNVIFIVNDDPRLAKEVNADGVHLGQEDALKYPLERARKILGESKIVGISTHSLAQFNDANQKGYDYTAYGPIFPTKTKDYFLGTGDIKNVIRIAKKPVFFIGGINLTNLGSVLREGAKNIALIRAVTESADITSAVKEFKERLKDGRYIGNRR